MPKPRRLLVRGIQIGLLAGLVFVGASLPRIGKLGTEISAKATCQCRYIDGGSDEFCTEDDLVHFLPLDYAFVPDERAVSSSLFGMTSSTGRYVSDFGCQVE